ncbi:MAG TPA: pyrroline-5-carboxylate reductase dimerization domain-containing protein [Pyrinomonadaceae bacterium]
MATQTATEFRLGVLGAGRLGEAIARAWLKRTGQAPLIWSRSGLCPGEKNALRVEEGAWVAQWTTVFDAQSLLIAIPGKAFLQLAEDNERARQFTGNIFSASASLSCASLKRVFPQATVFCVSPFLIDGVNSIPMLVLRSSDLLPAKWLEVKAELELLGEVDVIEDEEIFAQLALLGASWPSVVLAGVQAASAAGLKGIEDQDASRIGRRIFFRAVQSLLSGCTNAESEGAAETADIATPGGITERGLQSLSEVNNLFESAFKQMQARANELRA